MRQMKLSLWLVCVLSVAIVTNRAVAQEAAARGGVMGGMGGGVMVYTSDFTGTILITCDPSLQEIAQDLLMSERSSPFPSRTTRTGVLAIDVDLLGSTKSPTGTILARLNFRRSQDSPPTDGQEDEGFAMKGEEAFAAAVERLKKRLNATTEPHIKSLHLAAERAAMETKEAQDRTDQLLEEMYALRSQMLQFGALPEGLDQRIVALLQDRLMLRAEMAGLQARRHAIGEYASKSSAPSEAVREQQAQVIEQLERGVKARRDQIDVAKTMYASGVADRASIMELAAQLPLAEAELAERCLEFEQEADGGARKQLNEELAAVQIELATVEARHKVLDEALARLESNELRELLKQHERVAHQLETARDELKRAEQRRAEAARAVDTIKRPEVIVIDNE